MTDILTRTKGVVIAEAGTNHADPNPHKRVGKAARYAELAAEAGADIVKYQIFANPIKDDMFCWLPGDEERAVHWRGSAMGLAEWAIIKSHAERLGLIFLASVFQHTTVAWLEDMDCAATKVASRAAKDFPYHQGPKPHIVSNGMFDIPDRDGIIGMQCEANYPSTDWWKGVLPGFSDHSGTPERAIDALKRGCRLVEVHFHDDPEDAGPNLPASLTVKELSEVCKSVE